MSTLGRDARRAAAVSVAAVTVYSVYQLLVAARDVVLLGFLAIVLAVMIGRAVDRLARILPRSSAVVVVAILLFGGIFGLGELVAPRLVASSAQFAAQLSDVREQAERWWSERIGEGSISQVTGGTTRAMRHALPLAVSSVEFVATAFAIAVLALFLASERDRIREGLRMLTPDEHVATFDECWTRLGRTLRGWTGGIFVSMLIMGSFTAVGLWIAGVPMPFLLGLLTFFGTFVPYAGAIASAVPGLAIALSRSPRHFAYALLVYTAVHVVEGYLVEPMVMKRAVKMQPALLLFGQAAMSGLFGVLGLVVATPLIACAQTLVGYLWVERRLGRAKGAA